MDWAPELERARRGDRSAMAAVLGALVPRVRNLVRYLVRGDDIDDIAQEALIAVARGLDGYRGDAAFTAWTDRIVARVTFAAIRRARADRARVVIDLVDPEPHADEPGPDEVYAARRLAVDLLDRLSEDVRHAIVLHHVLGMSVPEVALELGVPAETIRSRLRLGIGRLRTSETAGAESNDFDQAVGE